METKIKYQNAAEFLLLMLCFKKFATIDEEDLNDYLEELNEKA